MILKFQYNPSTGSKVHWLEKNTGTRRYSINAQLTTIIFHFDVFFLLTSINSVNFSELHKLELMYILLVSVQSIWYFKLILVPIKYHPDEIIKAQKDTWGSQSSKY